MDNQWKCHLWTIEVGVRGLVAGSVRRCLRKLGFKNSDIRSLMRNVSVCVSRCSFAIYKSLRVTEWKWTSLVRIGTRPVPSELPGSPRKKRAQTDCKHATSTAKLSWLPSSSRPRPVTPDSKHDTPCLASTLSTAPRKSVSWATTLVSDMFIVTKLTKEEVCGVPGVDNWFHESKLRRAREKVEDQLRWDSRTFTWDDL